MCLPSWGVPQETGSLLGRRREMAHYRGQPVLVIMGQSRGGLALRKAATDSFLAFLSLRIRLQPHNCFDVSLKKAQSCGDQFYLELMTPDVKSAFSVTWKHYWILKAIQCRTLLIQEAVSTLLLSPSCTLSPS